MMDGLVNEIYFNDMRWDEWILMNSKESNHRTGHTYLDFTTCTSTN